MLVRLLSSQLHLFYKNLFYKINQKSKTYQGWESVKIAPCFFVFWVV